MNADASAEAGCLLFEVVLIGSDIPDLSGNVIAAAMSSLDSHDVSPHLSSARR